MPRYKCPFPDCTFETDDVQDSLAAVLISVYSMGTHTVAAPSTSGNAAAKVEKSATLLYPQQAQVRTGLTFSPGKTMLMQQNSMTKIRSSNY